MEDALRELIDVILISGSIQWTGETINTCNTHHVIELPKSYRMHVLVLKMITLNSSYRSSKIARVMRTLTLVSLPCQALYSHIDDS